MKKTISPLRMLIANLFDKDTYLLLKENDFSDTSEYFINLTLIKGRVNRNIF